jgi:hypothetical protein
MLNPSLVYMANQPWWLIITYNINWFKNPKTKVIFPDWYISMEKFNKRMNQLQHVTYLHIQIRNQDFGILLQGIQGLREVLPPDIKE